MTDPQPRRKLTSLPVLGLAVLIVLLSAAQLVYRLGLPGDGWTYARDTTGSGQRLILDEDLSRMPSALQAGDVLVAVEGRPMADILADAVASQPQRPAGWQVGNTVTYTVLREGKELQVEVLLLRLPVKRILSSVGYNLLINPAPLIMFLIALLVFYWHPQNTSARLLLLFSAAVFSSDGISQVVSGSNVIGPAEMLDRLAFWPAQFINSLIWPLLIAPLFLHLLITFNVFRSPLQRFPRLRLLFLYGYMPTLTLLAAITHLGRPLAFWQTWSTLSFIDFFAVLLVAIAGIILTLARSHPPAESAKIRWLAWGTLVTSIGALSGSLLISLGMSGAAFLIGWVLTRLLTLGFPIAVAIAVLRYRLFDIDIIIRRTLVYTIVTAALALVYLASVVLLQTVLRLFSPNAGSELVTVFSTLGIAALSVPLRRRVQDLIDRRFYRSRYNAERTLQAFNESLRYQVDLNQISDRIVTVVESTIHPKHVTLWLVKLKNQEPS